MLRLKKNKRSIFTGVKRGSAGGFPNSPASQTPARVRRLRAATCCSPFMLSCLHFSTDSTPPTGALLERLRLKPPSMSRFSRKDRLLYSELYPVSVRLPSVCRQSFQMRSQSGPSSARHTSGTLVVSLSLWGRMCSIVYSSTGTRSLRPWFSKRRSQ